MLPVEQALEMILGVRPTYMRPPFGSVGGVAVPTLRDLGYRLRRLGRFVARRQRGTHRQCRNERQRAYHPHARTPAVDRQRACPVGAELHAEQQSDTRDCGRVSGRSGWPVHPQSNR